MYSLARRRLLLTFSSSSLSRRRLLTYTSPSPPLNDSSLVPQPPRGIAAAPWSAVQRRGGAKYSGIDVRVGNFIQRKGKIFEVLKANHTQQGRGGATIQAELRDVDSGNKVTERFRTDETIEKVFVEERSFTFLYIEGNFVTVMDHDTFEQMEISKDLFGKAAAYLKEDMKITVQMFDGRLVSASVPHRVTCTVAEAQSHVKGLTAAPRYKRVVLDNGLTVMAPPFIEAGDEIVVNTVEDTYITRAKELSMGDAGHVQSFPQHLDVRRILVSLLWDLSAFSCETGQLGEIGHHIEETDGF
ncbi:hypothetical protein Sjap_012977 [Stephania japonica]|uniref:Elongation factor P n=1 Tax=Stephania japonica TaxID=461633 RepID=A0AAP0IY96_9MAGN